MRPVTLLKVTEFYPGDWLVYQRFDKNGESVTVRGWGRTRREALNDFDNEVRYAETHTEYTLLDCMACWLYDLAGKIDKEMKRCQ